MSNTPFEKCWSCILTRFSAQQKHASMLEKWSSPSRLSTGSPQLRTLDCYTINSRSQRVWLCWQKCWLFFLLPWCLLLTGWADCDIKGRVCCSSTGRLPLAQTGPHPLTWNIVRHITILATVELLLSEMISFVSSCHIYTKREECKKKKLWICTVYSLTVRMSAS